MTRSTAKNHEEEFSRISLQSPIDASEPAIIRTGKGDDLSISQAARQLSERRREPIPAAVADEIVWGAENIAPYLGRTTRGAFGALEGGKVPGAKKIAGRWALNLRVLNAAFEGEAK
jgi:hypothetical protein